MIALLCLAAPSPPPPRAIHYVIRVSELEEVLEFTDKVLGMKVLRHEENEAACEITCNGDFDNAWSKTMVGYGPESEGYALELTYNYGVRSYKEGNALVLAPRAAADAMRGANQPVAVRGAVGGGGAREVGVGRHRLSRSGPDELRGVNAAK